jgi:hypothetical protein
VVDGVASSKGREMSVTDRPPFWLVGLAGRIGHGKDAVCRMLAEEMPQLHVLMVGFADPLYAGLAAMLGCDEHVLRERTTKDGRIGRCPVPVRQGLQSFGKWARQQDERWLIELAEWRIGHAVPTPAVVTVTGLRSANEADWVHSLGGQVWYVRDVGRPAAHDDEDEVERGLAAHDVDRWLGWDSRHGDIGSQLAPLVRELIGSGTLAT